MNHYTRFLFAAFALTAVGNAQSASRTLSFFTPDARWGGTVSMASHADFSASSFLSATADLGASTSATVRINGITREAYFVRGDLDAAINGRFVTTPRPGLVYSADTTCAMLVRVNGTTVFNQSRTTATDIAALLNPISVGGAVSIDVPVCFYTVNVRASATAEVDMTLRPTLTISPRFARATVTGTGSVEGSASLGVSVLGVLGSGVIANLDFADPRVTLEAHTDFATAGGSISWSIDAVRLALSAYVDIIGARLVTIAAQTTLPGANGSIVFGL